MQMRHAEESFGGRAAEAYSRLIYELYMHGPIRLVPNDQHMDLVNNQGRLCCLREPFLEVLAVMEHERLVKNVGREENERVYALTDKGFLTAILIGYNQRSDDPCHCSKCAEAFDDVIRELLSSGSLQIVVGHSGHPHVVGARVRFCCNQKPYLKAMCTLERYRLVERQEDFVYRLTDTGKTSARIMLTTGSQSGEVSAWRN